MTECSTNHVFWHAADYSSWRFARTAVFLWSSSTDAAAGLWLSCDGISTAGDQSQPGLLLSIRVRLRFSEVFAGPKASSNRSVSTGQMIAPQNYIDPAHQEPSQQYQLQSYSQGAPSVGPQPYQLQQQNQFGLSEAPYSPLAYAQAYQQQPFYGQREVHASGGYPVGQPLRSDASSGFNQQRPGGFAAPPQPTASNMTAEARPAARHVQPQQNQMPYSSSFRQAPAPAPGVAPTVRSLPLSFNPPAREHQEVSS